MAANKYDYRDATQHTNAYRRKSEQKNKNHLNYRFHHKSDTNDYIADEYKNNINSNNNFTPMHGVTLEESSDQWIQSLILFFLFVHSFSHAIFFEICVCLHKNVLIAI